MCKFLIGLALSLGFLLVSPSTYAWDVSEEKDDFTEQKKLSAVQFEGGFVFFFNCTTGENPFPELRIATTMDWSEDLKEEMELQFKGPDSPLITVTSSLTANQSNKVLFVSRANEADDVLGLMRAFSETKNHVSFRISQTADSTKINGRGFSKAFKILDEECKLTSGVEM